MDNNYFFKKGINTFSTCCPTLHLPGGVLTEKIELQQNAVKKSKILSKNKLTASAMDQSVTNFKKVVKKLTEKNLKYTTRLKKAMKLL
ncbi:hypothetical protein evm_011825 [Chilo suppressalis]|nr:hypothetical protein evm_011825 [Chilo suppressalis]